MVALAVRSIDRRPVVCNARQLLHRAHDAAEFGNLIEAGCWLREAARVYLVAECEYSGCLPTNSKQLRSTTCLLKALHRCDEAEDFGSEWLEEIISYGNALAHCKPVDRARIDTCLMLMHLYLDHAPHLIQPKCGGRSS